MKQLHKYIHAMDINDAWFKSLWEIWQTGRVYDINDGSYAGEKRIALDCILIEIDYPITGNIIPVLPDKLKHLSPLTLEQAENYFIEYMFSTETTISDSKLNSKDRLETYGSRIHFSLQPIIDKFNKYGSGNNQCIIQIGAPKDILLKDPPCFRHIDIKIINGTLNFYIYFRSWEAFAGLPADLAGSKYLFDYLIENIRIDGKPLMNGKFICHSKCLHVYSHMLDVVDQVLGFPNDRRSKIELLNY